MKRLVKRIVPSSLLDAVNRQRARAQYRRNARMDPTHYRAAIEKWYLARTGVALNLDNPQTYDEKIQWLKLYDSTPEKGRLSDKYLVRTWIAEQIGEEYLVPLLGVYNSPDEIDFNVLPDKFVLKATHGCGWNILVRDKQALNIEAAKAQLQTWLDMDYSFVEMFELQYRYCEPRIIAEAYLENENDDLYDYKFFCFGGEVACIGFVRGRGGNSGEACFTKHWEKLPCTYYTHPRIEEDIPRPPQLECALAIAEKLSQGFPHVRVDLYLLPDGSIRFGEMTFSTLTGISLWNPPEYNYAFGSLIDLQALPAWKEMHGEPK